VFIIGSYNLKLDYIVVFIFIFIVVTFNVHILVVLIPIELGVFAVQKIIFFALVSIK